MRAGVTLLELLVILVILGLATGMSVGAMSSLKAPPKPTGVESSPRALAIRTGRPVSTWDSAGRLMLYLPDGRALASGVDPLTGRSNASR